MKRFIGMLLVTVLALGALTGCGPAKKSGAKLYGGTEDELKGFGACFSIEAGAGDFGASDARYNIVYVQDAGGLTQEPHAPTFIIPVYDDGATVQIAIIYTAGAQGENPTVSNSNWLSGTSVVTKSMSVTPDTNEETERAKIVAGVIYDALAEIEGK